MRKQKKVLTQFITGLVILAQVLASFSAAATAVIQPSTLAPLLGQPAVAQAAAAKPDVALSNQPIEVAAAAPVAMPLAAGGPASISGLVYNDYNADGTRDIAAGAPIDGGMGGVTVKAYDASGAVVGTTTSFAVTCLGNNNPAGQGCTAANTPSLGSYTLSALPATTPLRVEFTTLPTGYYPSAQGTGNATSVRFVTTTAGATASIDFGTLKPSDYSQNNPSLVTPVQSNGSGVGNTLPGLAMYPYSSSGGAAFTTVLNESQIGATWGEGYQRAPGRLFVAAYMKRQVGFKDGPGYVYVLNRVGNTLSAAGSFNLQGITPANGGPAIDLGSLCRRDNTDGDPNNNCLPLGGVASDYTLPANVNALSIDLDAYAKVSNASYGDIDVAEDDKTLWLVNLKQNALISLDISGPTGSFTNTVKQYLLSDLSAPTCGDFNNNGSAVPTGVLHPFALKFHGGKGYLGAVCDAYNSRETGDLHAFVLSFDPTNPGLGLTQVLSVSLDYKYNTLAVQSPAGNPSVRWFPWTTTWAQSNATRAGVVNQGFFMGLEPLLSDIEFTDNGSLVLGIMDRHADQHLAYNLLPIPGTTQISAVWAGGEIIRVCNVNGAYVMEGTAASCPVVAKGTGGANDGISGTGEFFVDTKADGQVEGFMSALALLPGADEVVGTFSDPFAFHQGGLAWWDTTTPGSPSRKYILYTSPNSGGAPYNGKGNGLGDVELLVDPAPIELGNRVWKDLNGNGVQDPGEPGIASVVVNLTTITGTVVAAATTDANGNYYFSSATGTTTASARYGLAIQPNTAYEIRIANATGASQQAALAGMTLTTANAQASTNDPITDVRDSDAAMNSTTAVIPYTTGVAGANNHGLDFGFYSFGTVQIVKQTVAGNGTFTFSSADSTFNNLSLTTSVGIGSSTVFTKPIGSYVITENSQAGWNLIGFWCSGDTDNGSTSNLASRQATLDLDAGENLVCTFANSATPPPTTGSNVLTVTKTINWNGNTPNPGKLFNINITGPSYPSGHADTITAGASKVYTNLTGGVYTVTEISPGAGWVTTYSVPSGVVTLGQPIAPTTAGPISGNVFRDFNADGVDAGATEPGVAGVSVIAYDPSGVAVGTATTAATGAYSFTPIKPGPYRIEFTNLPAGDEPTMHGPGNGTTTQFVTTNGGATNVNLGVNAPCDYCQDNPRLVVPIMRAGNNVGSVTEGLVSQLYNSATGAAAERADATLGQIGSTWGEGYQREQKRIYVGAMLKRHTGFGPQGPGGVYALDYSNPAAATLANSFTLQGITPANGGAAIDLGTINRTSVAGAIAAGAAGDYQLPTIGTNPSRDIDAFAKVGKTAYGDIDVDDTGNNLWLVNLNQRALIKMDVSGSPAALPGTTSQYPILGQAGVPTCTGGELRPWGLKFYLGKGYLGAVCDASISQNRNNLRAYVLAFDPANVGAGFSVAISVPLTQTREAVQNNALSPGFRTAQSDGTWKPWADTWAQTGLPTIDDDRLSYAQPILSDIEFLPGGDMVLGFANRFAEQSGMDNDYPISGSTTRYGINNAGDMVKACNVGGTYVLESYLGCPEGDTGTGNQQGADGFSNGGEFFWGEKFLVGGIIHNEIANGSLAVLPGSNEVVSSAFDPAVVGLGGGAGATGAFGQGLIFLNTTTGDRNDGWQIDQAQPVQSYDPSRFGKGNAMGDVEVLCDLAPLEIGNRVWKDLNGNGVQDPGEPGVNGITISRQGPTSTITTVTSGDGNYYFGNLKANTAYTLTINPSQAALSGLSLTQANAQAISGSTTSNHAINDTRDSDAVTIGGNATIYYTTGSAGQNNHGLDFGWTAPAFTGAVKIGNTAPQIGAIIIRKATVPAGSNQTFNFTSNVPNYASFTLSDGGSYTMREIPVGSYTVTETVLAGWTQANSNCTNSSTLGTIQVSHSLTTTCTILNAMQPTSTNTLTVTKTVNWNGNPPAPGKLFNINIIGPSYPSGHADTITAGASNVYPNLTAGIYTVTETSPGSGWVMTYTVGNVNSPSAGVVNLNSQAIAPTTAGLISGNVFRDYNADGVDAGTTEPGVAGVTVTAYDPYGVAVGAATTAATGAYSFTPSKPGPYRVEFTTLSAGDAPTMHGTGNGTSTQFVTTNGGATNVNLGVNIPADYCQNNPKVCTTVFANGLPSAAGYPSSIVSFDYNLSGQSPQEAQVAARSVTGAVWGLAYARNTKTLYSSAFVKRHSGLYENPAGTPHPGMIFVSDLAGGTTAPFIDLANYGASVGAVPSNSTRGLGASGANSADAAVFDLVGKAGLGDVDISTDETTLWAVSLNDKKLFKITIDADNNPSTPPAPGDVTSYQIPTPSCTGGAWRPFAVKYGNNAVYVGGVCDAQTSQLKADLQAYVYKFDISLGTFTNVLSSSLNYPKQAALGTGFGCPAITGWYGWASTFAQVTTPLCYAGPPAGVVHPQPMLTDLEFDIDGSLILGFADRAGHQGGRFNADTSGNGSYEFMVGGDILRACANGSGGYTLESGGKCNGVGPGGTEYYSGDSFSFSGVGVLHGETSHGGLALKPGSGEVVVSAMDPVDGNGNQQVSGGVLYLNNTTGLKNRSYAVYANNDNPGGILGKSGGMGDVELLCDAAPLEIGNRVWKDLNGNGVQDPGEPGVNGITISRQGPTSTVTTVTSVDGNYYFGNLKANTAYTLTINPSQATLSGLRLTQANAQAISGSPSSNDAINDTRDSDAVTIGGKATIYYTTGNAGQNNHGLDFGWTTPLAGAVAITNTAAVLRYDFGDDPDGYNTVYTNTGPAHVIVPGLHLGANEDNETDGQPNTGANGDGNDEDGVSFPTLQAGSSAVLTVTATNTGSTPAVIYGWIDFNGNGQFEASERITTTVPAGTTNGVFALPYNVPANAVSSTYARFRLSTDTAAAQPTGVAADGEVEDYPVTIQVTAPAQFGDRVWLESDTDGKANTGTLTPVAGIIVTATNGTNTYTKTSTSQGYYSFTVPAGTYTVTYGGVPAAYGSVTPSSTPGGNSETGNAGSYQQSGNPDQSHVNGTTVSVAAGEANWHVDFAFTPVLVKLGNRLWIESDTDGNATTGTVTPVVGQLVTATSSNGVVYTTTTNANGLYTITVPANRVYTVTTSTPLGTVPSTVIANVANDGNAIANNDKNHRNTGTPVTVTTQDNLSVDFGFHTPLAQFGDRVWIESDTDGRANTGTLTPVAGMTITATNGTSIYTKTTTSQGYYSFTVPAGTYTVTYGNVPASYGNVTPSSTPGGNSESGNAGVYAQTGNPDQSHVNGTTVTVAAGQANWHVDFAFHPLVKIGNRLWIESDTDGDAATGIVIPVVGQVVTATSSNGVVYTTTTDANGLYTITVPASNVYTVTTGTPLGTVPSTVIANVANDGNATANNDKNHRNTGTPVTVTTQDNLSVDFGFHYAPAQFGDRVWLESDTDGLANTGVITPVAGIVITATASNSQVYTTISNNQGYYSFTVPANLTYTVQYGAVPAGYGTVVPSSTPGGNSESGNVGSYAQSGNPDQSHAQATTVFLLPSEANWHVDFAFHAVVKLGNRLWIENDTDGDATTGTVVPVIGQVVTATSSSGVVYTTTTNGSGLYTITVPANDVYTVTTGIPTGTTPSVFNGTPGNDQSHNSSGTPVTLGTTDNLTIDFGFHAPLAQLGDRVWIESDMDGLASTGVITPVAGIVITATASNSQVYTMTTNNQGYYSFTVPTDTYTVTYGSVPNSYGNVTPSSTPGGSSESGNAGVYAEPGKPDQSHRNHTIVTVGDGEANWHVDFSFHAVVKIGNRLWIENDTDGDATTGTVLPVIGQVVTATSSSGVVYTTTTDANGLYTITVPAHAVYTVTTGIPAGTLPSALITTVADDNNQVTNDNKNHDHTGTRVTVNGTDNLSVDFGFYPPTPTIDLKKSTNGDDADTATGPTVAVGTTVTWTYAITNTGNVTLTNITLADDREGRVTCPQNTLVVGASMTCVLTGTALAGQYANTAIVTGTPTLGPTTPVTSTNPSHYLGLTAGLGDRVWYDDNHNGLQEPGDIGVSGVTVELRNSSGAVISTTQTSATGYYSFTNLVPGIYSLHFVTSTLPAGYELTFQNRGANDKDSDANPITGETIVTLLVGSEYDPTWDAGIWRPQPSIDLRKYTNGYDANALTGPTVAVGTTVTWTYAITNTGNVTLTNVTLADDQEGRVTCPQNTLVVGASMTCVLTGTALAGQYANTAIVTGTPTLGPTTPVTHSNPSHYFGADPKLVLKKYTNGADADTVPGPQVLVGSVVTWTYVVTNTGNITLTTLTLTDDKVGAITCPVTQLAAGATTLCTQTGVAQLGQYTNTAIITGTPQVPPVTPPDLPGFPPAVPPTTPVTDTNPSHYYGYAPSIVLKKYTNGYDADSITGPYLQPGSVVTWTYVVTNTGNVTLTNVTLTDDKLGGVTCPMAQLTPGATTTCTKSGVATAGQYTNTAVVTGTNVLSPTQKVTSTNPSHYFGYQPGFVLKKYTNGYDADAVSDAQPVLQLGAPVTWTYTVTNTGNVTLSFAANSLQDDQEGAINGAAFTLPPGATTTVTKHGFATTLGQYTNTATVPGIPVVPPVTPPDLPGFPPITPPTPPITHTNPSHYQTTPAPAIVLRKYTNGYDADIITGPYLQLGSVVTWTYVITNIGNVTLTNVTLTDDKVGGVTCPVRTLTPGATTTCTQTGVATAGQYTNTAVVTGTNVLSPTQPVTSTNPSHYFGAVSQIVLKKYTNGADADTVPGPQVVVGSVVTWTYVMTNTGNVALTNLSLTDDKVGSITCLVTQLAAGASTRCTTTGVAQLGQYTNTAIITGTPQVPPVTPPDLPGFPPAVPPTAPVTDTNPSHYFGVGLSLGNRLWVDNGAGVAVNRNNGVYDNGEQPVPQGVIVELLNITGTVLFTTTTDSNGYYRFDKLTLGQYAVRIPASEFALGGQLYGYESSTGQTTTFGAGDNNHDHGDDAELNGVTSQLVTLSATNPMGEVDSGATGAGANGPSGDAYDNLTVDFGFVPYAQFGNFVWIESDSDGKAATGTITPVVGKVVTATSGTGEVYTTTTTVNGYYTFTVPTGTYTVTYGVPPTGTVPSATPNGNTTDKNNPGTDQQSRPNNTVVTLTPGDNILTIDFGFHMPPAQFGDRVWLESDTDGVASTGVITPVAGLKIMATDGTNTYTTTTDANGYYSFTAPAGTYTVTYGSVPASYGVTMPSSTPGGSSESGNAGVYQQSGKPDQSHVNGTTVTVTTGEANWHVDFAVHNVVQIGNRLWIENDRDGDATTGTVTPVVGQVVTATSSSGVVYTTTTDATGLYTITVPTNDVYTVTTVIPIGTTPSVFNGTPGNDQSHNPSRTRVPVGITDDLTIDFGFHAPMAQFGDRVWLESDTDGKANTGIITPVAGMTIMATDGTNTYTTTTNVAGYYSFTVPAGMYTVTYGMMPAGYGVTTPSSTPGGNSESGNAGVYQETGQPDLSHVNHTIVTVSDGQANWHVDFAFHNLVQIGNRLWIENDRDGDATTGTTIPVVVQVVTVTSSSGKIYTTTTDATGLYTVTVPANDTYTVTTGTPAGTTSSVYNGTPGDNQSHTPTGTVVTVGTMNNTTIDFGFHIPFAQFGDRVWVESDNDGRANTGSLTPVAGMTITATNSGGQVYMTQTNANGYYSFTVPAGTYTVTYGSVPVSYGVTIPSSTPGGNSETGNAGVYAELGQPDQSHVNGTTVRVADGEANWHVDFAFTPVLVKIGNRLWIEDDTDGDATTGTATPVVNHVVTATSSSGQVYTTTTDSNGYYTITVPANSGLYTVTTSTPVGTVPSVYNGTPGDNQSHNPTSTPVTVGMTDILTIDFGFHVPPAQFGDRVWLESDNDGLATTGVITPVAGMVITATGSNGLTYTTTTNSNGYYSFTLAASTYTVTYGSVPNTYGTVTPSATPAGNTETGNAGVYAQSGNPDQSHGNGTTVTVAAGEANWHVDFAFYAPLATFGNHLWIETDTDGKASTGVITPVVGKVLTATNQSGNVYTTTTDVNGYYTFTVPAGTYTVNYGQPPAGAVPSNTPNGNTADKNNPGTDEQSRPNNTVVTLTPGDHISTIDFSFHPVYSLGNRLWVDNGAGVSANRNNGIYDTGEQAVPQGVVVELLNITGTVVATTNTDVNGYYRFDNLLAAQYAVRIPASEFQTGGKLVGYVSSMGQTTTFVATDNNHDHGDDTVNDGVTSSLVTLGATNPVSEVDSGATGAGANGPSGDTNDNLTVDFGFVPQATFGNFVWIESDSDGKASTGAITPVIGKVITATDSSGNVYTTTTNLNGYYTFTVPTGTYTVTYGVPPAGTVPSATPNPGTADKNNPGNDQQSRPNNTVVTLTPGDNVPTIDFGFHQPVAQLGDRVWIESDSDGKANTGALIPVAGMVITATSGSGGVYTTTTNANGYYSFTVPVDTYSVTYGSVPASYGSVMPSSTPGGNSESGNAGMYAETGTPDQSHMNGTTVTVVDGEANWHVDFAFTPVLVKLGNRLWIESDTDGDATTGTVTPVVGQTVTATSSNGKIYTTTTDANGLYTITVPANDSYTVTTGTPVGTTPSVFTGTPGDNQSHNPTGTLVMVGTTDNLTIDFGFHVQTYSLGNRLWVDDGAGNAANRDNGVYNNGEQPVPQGVIVELLNITGTVVSTTTTDSNGYYRFDHLPAGQYQARVAASNFVTGDKLYGYVSSTGQSSDFTTAGNNIDHGDNPVNATSSGVQSALVTLGATNPTGEVDSGATGAGANGSSGDANDNLTVDFGFVPVAQFGNFVWIESDKDGNAGTGAITPVVGKVITATDANGKVYTATTNVNGYYSFTVPTGTYTVNYGVPPAGTAPSATPNGSTADKNNPGADQQSRPHNTVVTLTPGDNIPTIDFGFYTPLSLGNLVWFDANNNGMVDVGEQGIPGVTVTLYLSGTNTPLRTTTTDANGKYLFTDLTEGSYIVEVTTPAGYLSSSDIATTNTPDSNDNDDNGVTVNATNVRSTVVTLRAGTEPANESDQSQPINGVVDSTLPANSNFQVDFGFYRPVSVGNYVWIDANGDGKQDSTEQPLPGAVVTLFKADGVTSATDVNGNPVPAQTTGSDGKYLFTNLSPGDYVIKVTPPAGYVLTKGGANPNNDDNTDSNGVPIGNSIQSLPVTLTAGAEPIDDGDTSPDSNLTVDFGFYQPVTVGDRVWYDNNGNGQQDNPVDEPGVAGVTVTLYDATTKQPVLVNGNPLTTPTNGNGSYLFVNLPPGNYAVVFDLKTLPVGYGPTIQNASGVAEKDNSDANLTTGQTRETGFLPGGQQDLNLDLGIVAKVNLGNLVWIDANNNGVVDAGEPGIPGVIVQLFPAGDDPTTATPLAQTTTDAAGHYNFTNLLPGSYFVYIPTPPLQYLKSSTPTDINDDGKDNDDNGSQTTIGAPVRSPVVTLTIGAEPTNDGDGANGDLTVDFGFYALASLGDYVWFDANKNGSQEGTETGVPGVPVTLYTGDGVKLATTTTDASGHYGFAQLEPGDYFVEFTPPAAYLVSPLNQGGDDTFDSDVDQSINFRTPVTHLTSGQHDPTLDLGLYLPTQPAAIGDRVWFDTNKDGVQDATETGIPGVSVTLYKADSTVVATTTTDVNGNYLFANLPPGDYFVQFTPPTAYKPSPQNQGDDTKDSDADGTTGRTILTTLDAGETDRTWDAGFYLDTLPASIGDYVWYDANLNGIQDANETGIPGVKVNLYDGAGHLLATMLTDANGKYEFTNLAPGDYSLQFLAPQGYLPSPQNKGSDDAIDSDDDLTTGRTIVTTLEPGEHDLSWDAGFYLVDVDAPGIITQPASLGDRVWLDKNKNGLQDGDEQQGVPGVMVKLYTANGDLRAITTSDANGNYSFNNLAPGSYYVVFILPPDYIITTPHVGDKTTDSDLDANTGRTLPVTLGSGEHNPTLDVGIFQNPSALDEEAEPQAPGKNSIFLPIISR